VRRFGPDDSPLPVLFVHGLGESGLCFESLCADRRLSELELMVPDLAGYGRSAWPEEIRTLEAVANDLADWIEGCVGRPVLLVGHSMGGVLGLLLAETQPRWVAGLLDVEGNKSLGDCTYSGKAAAMGKDAFLEGGFELLRDQLYLPGLDEPSLRGYYVSQRLADPCTFFQHSLDLVRLSTREDMALRLAGLPMPVLYMPGAGRDGGACDRSLELVDQAGVPMTAVGPAGHWPFIDQPDAFVRVLLRFHDAVARQR
jgi:pimeloyl-ACP methyl ester carboxylesterase